jgi:hypothetical protein
VLLADDGVDALLLKKVEKSTSVIEWSDNGRKPQARRIVTW